MYLSQGMSQTSASDLSSIKIITWNMELCQVPVKLLDPTYKSRGHLSINFGVASEFSIRYARVEGR
jgi:hypothetical protein